MKSITKSVLRGLIKEHIEVIFDHLTGKVIQDVFEEEYRKKYIKVFHI